MYFSIRECDLQGSAGENTSSVPKMPVYSSRRSKFQNVYFVMRDLTFSSNQHSSLVISPSSLPNWICIENMIYLRQLMDWNQ